MNETLKGVAHIGAELAAAKADLQLEMERHRKTWRQLEQVTGVLREIEDEVLLDNSTVARIQIALSQQAEPVEPVPAQDELLPCDCGSNDNSIGYESPQGYWVECGDCGHKTEKTHGRDLAINEWNRRNRPAQDDLVSASDVREALEFYEKATNRFVVPKGVSEHQDQFVQGWLAKAEHTRSAQTAPQGKFRMGDLAQQEIDMQHTDKMRAEFEAWAASFGRDIAWSFKVGAYIDAGVDEDWDVWQASRAALVVELPEEVANVTNKDFEAGRDAVVSAIEAAGVTVRG